MVVDIIALNSYSFLFSHARETFQTHFSSTIVIKLHAKHFLNNSSFIFIQSGMNEWMNEFDGASRRIIIQFVCRFFHPFFLLIRSFNHFKYGINNARFRLNIFNRMCFCLNAAPCTRSSPDTRYVFFTFQFFLTFCAYFTAQMLYHVCSFARSLLCVWEKENIESKLHVQQKRTHTVACASRTAAHILTYRQASE